MPIFSLRLLLTLALLFCCWSKPVDGLDIENCGRALGLESGRILDDQLSASSAFDPLSTGPANARLNSESGSGAWCPAVQINASSHEWVQVELRQPNLITAVRTQGRWDKGRGMEFPSAYMLEYWREELGRWARYKDATGNEIITGNSDTQSPVLRWLDGGFVAKLVRLIPVSESIRTVCLRFELYGCPFKEPLISYSAPIGAVVDSLDLRDLSYDGTTGGQQSNWLQGGLGRIFDGITGENTNFVANPRGWLGWHRRQQLGQFVPLEFLFARRQNFSALLLHTSNNRRLGARTFGSARLHFSPFGGEFSPRTFQWDLAEEDEPEEAHWVRIPIPHRVGSRLRVELFFGAEADWLLISEVRFESEDDRLAERMPPKAIGSSDNFSTFSYLADDETEAESNRRQQHQELWPASGGCLLLVFVCLAVCLSSACLCLCLFALAHRRRRPTPAKGQRRRLCGDSSKSGCGSSSSSSSYSPASLHSKPWLIQQLVHARTGSGKKAAIGTESLLMKSTAGDADCKELMDIARLVMRAEPSGSKAEMGGSGEDADSDQYADPDAPLCMAHNCTPSRQQQPGQLHYATRDLLMRRPAGSEFSLGDFLPMNGSSGGGHVSESPSAATESSYRYRATPTLANFPGPPPLWAPPLPPAPPPRRFD